MFADFLEWVKKNAGLYSALRRIEPSANETLSNAYYSIMKFMVSVFDVPQMSEGERVHHGQALRAMLHGWAELERQGSFELAQDVDWSYARAVADFSRSVFKEA